jgi:hypothetical protein
MMKNQNSKSGDRVRIYRWKSHFEKGRAENWTREIFVVSKVKKTNPITYELNDLNGEPILGGFYANVVIVVSQQNSRMVAVCVIYVCTWLQTNRSTSSTYMICRSATARRLDGFTTYLLSRDA